MLRGRERLSRLDSSGQQLPNKLLGRDPLALSKPEVLSRQVSLDQQVPNNPVRLNSKQVNRD